MTRKWVACEPFESTLFDVAKHLYLLEHEVCCQTQILATRIWSLLSDSHTCRIRPSNVLSQKLCVISSERWRTKKIHFSFLCFCFCTHTGNLCKLYSRPSQCAAVPECSVARLVFAGKLRCAVNISHFWTKKRLKSINFVRFLDRGCKTHYFMCIVARRICMRTWTNLCRTTRKSKRWWAEHVRSRMCWT